MADPIEVERKGSRAELVLNRPARRNAITGPLAKALGEAVRELSGDDEVNAVLLRGAEGSFCSGLDLKEFNAEPPPDWLEAYPDFWLDAHVALYECPKPIVVALERFAINGGAALALAGDLVVAGEDAFLQVGEVQQGVGAPMNLGWLRVRHSEAVSARVALSGRRLPAPELLRLGIVSELVPNAEVLSRARELADELASFPPAGTRHVKAGLRAPGPVVDARAWFAGMRSEELLPGRAGNLKAARG